MDHILLNDLPYGSLLIFALYGSLPNQPPAAELQGFVQKLFMAPFTTLGRRMRSNCLSVNSFLTEF